MQPSLCEEELYRKAEVTAAGMLSRRPLSAAMLERKLLDEAEQRQVIDAVLEAL